MANVIIYTDQNGVATVVHPNFAAKPEGMSDSDYEDLVITNDVPPGSSNVAKIDPSELPQDKIFRKAWKVEQSKIMIDFEEAKDVQRERIRRVRNDVLNRSDIEFMKTLESGDSDKVAAISVKKQALRDATEHSSIDSAATIEDLKNVFPEGLDAPDNITFDNLEQ